MIDELPRNVPAEQALIGACLTLQRIEGDCEKVLPKHFSDRHLGEVWSAMRSLVQRGSDLDIVTLNGALAGQDDKVEILIELNRLIGEVPSHLHAESYARDILTTHAKRQLALQLSDWARLAYGDGFRDPLSVFARVDADLQKLREGTPSNRWEFYSIAEIAAMRDAGALPQMPELVPGLIVGEGLNLIAGDTSSGKTWLILQACLGIAADLDVWARPTREKGRVLLFGKDTAAKMLFNRALELCDGLEIDYPHDLKIAWSEGDDDLRLNDPTGLANLMQQIREYEPVLVAIDDLTAYAPGTDLNDAGAVSEVLSNLRKISRQTGASFLIATLLNKGNASTIGSLLYRIGGSVHIPGKADSAVVVTRTGQGSTAVRTLTQVKHRMAEEELALTFTIQDGEDAGTVLAFERTSGARAAETLVEFAALAMVEVLKDSPGVFFDRKELAEAARAQGLNAGSRTIKDAWKIVQAIDDVQVDKQGRRYVYSWGPVPDLFSEEE